MMHPFLMTLKLLQALDCYFGIMVQRFVRGTTSVQSIVVWAVEKWRSRSFKFIFSRWRCGWCGRCSWWKWSRRGFHCRIGWVGLAFRRKLAHVFHFSNCRLGGCINSGSLTWSNITIASRTKVQMEKLFRHLELKTGQPIESGRLYTVRKFLSEDIESVILDYECWTSTTIFVLVNFQRTKICLIARCAFWQTFISNKRL